MSRAPKISVILPVFNGQATIENAVRSILDGTFTDLEVVCVNDGSTDGTASILDELARHDPRLRVLHCPHRGLVLALNTALEVSKGDWIARMDADDLSHPTRLEKQACLLERHRDVSLVSCLVSISHPDGSPLDMGMKRYQEWVNQLTTPDAIALERFVESPVVHPTILAKRHVFSSGYRKGSFPEDYDIWLRRLEAGDRFEKVPEVLYTWHDVSNRRTRTHHSCSPTAFRRLKLQYLLSGPLKGVKDVIVWGTGRNGKRWMRELAVLGLRSPLAVELDPRKIGKIIHGALVIRPDELTVHSHGEIILSAVGAVGGRQWVRNWLTTRGYQEGLDFWAVC